MQPKRHWFVFLLIFYPLISISARLGLPEAPRTVVVSTNADSGEGTLRAALLDAQAGDLIQFSPDVFPKRAPSTISLLSELPTLESGGITIDASSAGVILDGTQLKGGANGLRIHSNGNSIRGLQILHFSADGIYISDGASGNTIGGSGIGEGNTIGANGKSGITITGHGTDGNSIIANHIGIDSAGVSALPNGMHGVNVDGGPDGTIIGGKFGAQGNLVGGNLSAGILISRVTHTIIQGNVIGLDVSLLHPIGNATWGIVLIGCTGTLVGGEDASFGNIIGGSQGGVDIWQGAAGNVISGNQVGYRGFSGNGTYGIRLSQAAHDNIIGPQNIISYNGEGGILIDGEDSLRNTITANSIFQNKGSVLQITGVDQHTVPSVSINDVTSRSASGSAPPGSRVEIYSDMVGEARYYEGSTLADEQGKFYFLLPSGSFQGKVVSAIALNAQGNTSSFSQGLPIPGFGAVRELPNIPSPAQVSRDPEVVGTNLLIALISVVYFGFTTSIFNNLVKKVQFTLTGLEKLLYPLRRFSRLDGLGLSGPGGMWYLKIRFIGLWIAITLVNSTIQSFLNPSPVIFDAERGRVILGLVAAGLIVSGLKLAADSVFHKRLGNRPDMRAELRWHGLLIALASMIFSRSLGFKPGYLLGTLGMVLILPSIMERDRAGKRVLVVLGFLFGTSLSLWLVSPFLSEKFAWLEAIILSVFASAISGVLFELLPFSFFEGSKLWKWKKAYWFLFFTPVCFLFIHLFLNPDAKAVKALQQNGVTTLLVVMLVYALATFGLWLVYRRNNREANRAS